MWAASARNTFLRAMTKCPCRRAPSRCSGAQSCMARRAIKPCFGRKFVETGGAVQRTLSETGRTLIETDARSCTSDARYTKLIAARTRLGLKVGVSQALCSFHLRRTNGLLPRVEWIRGRLSRSTEFLAMGNERRSQCRRNLPEKMEQGGLKLAMIFATGFLAGFARLKPLRDHRQKTARFPCGSTSSRVRSVSTIVRRDL